MMNVRGYCRVHTKLHTKEISLKDQEMYIINFCEHHHHPLMKIYKDTSDDDNGDVNRPQLQLLLDELIRGELVVVVDLTCLSVIPRITLTIIDKFTKKRAKFASLTHSCGDSPIGEFLMTYQMILNQLEHEGIDAEEFYRYLCSLGGCESTIMMGQAGIKYWQNRKESLVQYLTPFHNTDPNKASPRLNLPPPPNTSFPRTMLNLPPYPNKSSPRLNLPPPPPNKTSQRLNLPPYPSTKL